MRNERYMNKIELKTLAPEINVSIPESAGGNLTADDVTDYIRKMLNRADELPDIGIARMMKGV